MRGRVRSVFHEIAQSIRRALVATGADRAIYPLSRVIPLEPLWALLRPDIYAYGPGTVRRVRRNGIWLDVDPNDYVQWLAYHGVERRLRKQLHALVRPRMTAIDVGSNIGEVLLNFARDVGPSGRVIGFEVNPPTYEHCCRNMELNGFPWAEVHPVGLGDKDDELHFGRRQASNSGADAVMPEGEGTIKVPMTTLDRFCTSHGIERVDLIKIDVEGYETHVLKGAEAVIGRHRPILFIEICDDNLRTQGSSAAELVALVERHDYLLTKAERGEPVTAGDNFDGCFFDAICRPRR